MRFADGSTQPRPAPWTIRQTEYTASGPAAMPAELPATSKYTYAVELSVDEAQAAGASSVEFTPAAPDTHAVVQYVENFIDAPVGSGVPSGTYDRVEAEWEPSRTGRVVKVISVTAGRANLDTDGDGDSDSSDYPAALKITDGERRALAPLYPAGAELWRIPVEHFSPGDYNWGGGLPAGARLPRLGPDGQPLPDGCPQPASSTIDCEDQRLREDMPVAGHAVLAVVLVRLGAEPGRPQAPGAPVGGSGPSETCSSCACRCRSRVARTCGATPARRTRATTHRRWCPAWRRRSTGTGSTPTASPFRSPRPISRSSTTTRASTR